MLLITHTVDPVNLKSNGQVVSTYQMFKILKSVIFMNQVLFQIISHMHMLKKATINDDINLSFRIKGQKTESNAFFCNTYRDNICPPLSSPMVYFNIGLYGEKSQDKAICSHRHNAKDKLNTYKKFSNN